MRGSVRTALCCIGLAGCFVEPPASGNGADDGNATTGSATSATTDSGSLETGTSSGSLPDSTTGTDGVDEGTTDAATDSDGSSGEPDASFFDDFERPDSEIVGNGWVERTEDAFGIAGGRVVATAEVMSFEQGMLYRPFGEGPADVTVEVEFIPTEPTLQSTPQVHARIQPGTLDAVGSINSYILFTQGPGSTLFLGRFPGDQGLPADLGTAPIVPAIAVGATLRFRLTVEGTDPVMLTGLLERETEPGVWETSAMVAAMDTEEGRLTDPGTVGLSAVGTAAFSYDNVSVAPR